MAKHGKNRHGRREKTSKIRQKDLKNAFTFFNKCRFQYTFDLCTSTKISTKAVHFQYKKKCTGCKTH